MSNTKDKKKKREYDKKWRLKNLKTISAKNKTWRKKNRKRLLDGQRLYRIKNNIKIKVRDAKKRADRKGLKYNISESFINKLIKEQDNKCIYTNIDFDISSKLYSLSIDRIDSSKGYIKGNIQLVCSVVNRMKSNLSEEEFLIIIEKIYVKFFKASEENRSKEIKQGG